MPDAEKDPRTPGRSAWDYGLPQVAVESVDASIRDVLGSANHDAHRFEIAGTGSRVVIENMAAAIVHDLLTSGAMSPAIPDVPPPTRDLPPAEHRTFHCDQCHQPALNIDANGLCRSCRPSVIPSETTQP